MKGDKESIRPLHPVHFSVRGRNVIPRDMERFPCEPEVHDALTRVACNIFTDVSNAGHSFQDALTAIYLSGLMHGAHVKGELDGQRTTGG